MAQTIRDRVVRLLERNSIPFQAHEHPPVYTSEQAARVRGTPMASGAKALVCKCDDTFHMFVMPADRKLVTKYLRRQKICRRNRFATLEEVKSITGLTPGCIPPFGSIFDLKTFCDIRLSRNEFINFNAGDHGFSIRMRYDDYIKVEQPILGEYVNV